MMTGPDIDRLKSNGETPKIIGRIRRKVEVMRLDQKASGSTRYYDSNEILTLLDMLERNLGFK